VEHVREEFDMESMLNWIQDELIKRGKIAVLDDIDLVLELEAEYMLKNGIHVIEFEPYEEGD